MSLKKIDRQCFRVFFKSGMKMKNNNKLLQCPKHFNFYGFLENHTCIQDIQQAEDWRLESLGAKVWVRCFRP